MVGCILPRLGLKTSAVAHGGNHAICYNGGNLRNAMAPQDRTFRYK